MAKHTTGELVSGRCAIVQAPPIQRWRALHWKSLVFRSPARAGGFFGPISVLITVAIGGVLAVMQTAALAQPRGDDPYRAIDEFEVEKHGAPLIIPVTITTREQLATDRERTYKMLIDTACGITIFDLEHRESFGRSLGKVTFPAPRGDLEVEAVSGPMIHFGRSSLEPRAVYCGDLQPTREIVGEDVDGILGINSFLGAISIDFDAGRLRFHLGADPHFGQRVPLEMDTPGNRGYLGVRAVLDNLAGSAFAIDTGSIAMFAGSIATQPQNELLKRHYLTAVGSPSHLEYDPHSYAKTTMTEMQMGRVKRFSLAGYEHKSLVFGKHSVNVLGLGYLSRFQVLFDIPNRQMYLRPGKEFDRRELYDLSGLLLCRREGRVVVDAVVEASTAAQAGIQKGDVVTAIDGKEARGCALFVIRRRLCDAGERTLDVSRHGVAQRVTLALQRN